MPQQTKIFRVFVSSTFTDMKEERRILQRDVFPRLEKFCEQNGARFQGIDLRWGVNEKTSLNQETLQTCFNEIDRCQKISPMPNFLILLGDKYGWQPIPEKIPMNEMDKIRNKLSKDDAIFLLKEAEDDRGWYRLDTNAIPAEYVLQARGEELKEYDAWQPIEDEIRKILRNAVDELDFSDEQKVKYFYSATHQEIMRGALKPPIGTENPQEHVFAFIRETEGLPKDETAKGFIDLDGEQQDSFSEKQLIELKAELKSKLGNHCIEYGAKWVKDQTKIDDSDWFREETFSRLSAIIQKQIDEAISPKEIEHEIGLHKAFRRRLTNYFRGRDEILKSIRNYLNDPSNNKVLSLIGESGSGKSSVMGEASWRYENIDNTKLNVYRFLGTTSSSTNIITLLVE